MRLFILDLMAGYTMSLHGVHAAIIPVHGGASPATSPTARLIITDHWRMFEEYLDETYKEYNDFQDYGQSLQHALDVATDPDFLWAGYRSHLKNHIIIYVTSTLAFSDKPSTASILNNNTYGIITVGYGPGITRWNSPAFQNTSGGAACYFPAQTPQDLDGNYHDNVLYKFQDLITKAASNGGMYCGNGLAS